MERKKEREKGRAKRESGRGRGRGWGKRVLSIQHSLEIRVTCPVERPRLAAASTASSTCIYTYTMTCEPRPRLLCSATCNPSRDTKNGCTGMCMQHDTTCPCRGQPRWPIAINSLKPTSSTFFVLSHWQKILFPHTTTPGEPSISSAI